MVPAINVCNNVIWEQMIVDDGNCSLLEPESVVVIGVLNLFYSMLQICIADQALDIQDVARLYIGFLQGFENVTNTANEAISFSWGFYFVRHTVSLPLTILLYISY